MKHVLKTLSYSMLLISSLKATAIMTQHSQHAQIVTHPIGTKQEITLSADDLLTITPATSSSIIVCIDLKGTKSSADLISRVVQLGPLLSHLQDIDLSNSDVTLQDLELLKDIKPQGGFVRSEPTIDGASGYRVARINVNLSGTEISRTNKWELRNKTVKPVEPSQSIVFLGEDESDEAHLQIYPKF